MARLGRWPGTIPEDRLWLGVKVCSGFLSRSGQGWVPGSGYLVGEARGGQGRLLLTVLYFLGRHGTPGSHWATAESTSGSPQSLEARARLPFFKLQGGNRQKVVT
jgi:hypothetical protein